MKKFYMLGSFIAASALLSIPHAQAEVAARIVAPAALVPKCNIVENASLSLNFGNVLLEVGKAQTYIQENITEIQNMAKEVGLENLEVNNMNYNFYSDSNNYTAYTGHSADNSGRPLQMRLSGNITFAIPDVEKGLALMEKAGLKGFSINYSVNANRQCY